MCRLTPSVLNVSGGKMKLFLLKVSYVLPAHTLGFCKAKIRERIMDQWTPWWGGNFYMKSWGCSQIQDPRCDQLCCTNTFQSGVQNKSHKWSVHSSCTDFATEQTKSIMANVSSVNVSSQQRHTSLTISTISTSKATLRAEEKDQAKRRERVHCYNAAKYSLL